MFRIGYKRKMDQTELSPWSRVLLEKLTDPQLVKKCPAFYGTCRFNTTFIRAHHLSLSSAYTLNQNVILTSAFQPLRSAMGTSKLWFKYLLFNFIS
jgi:hypothetical protein